MGKISDILSIGNHKVRYADEPETYITRLLAKNGGTMSLGVILNRIRGVNGDVVFKILSAMVRDGKLILEVSLHSKTKCKVYKYSIPDHITP